MHEQIELSDAEKTYSCFKEYVNSSLKHVIFFDQDKNYIPPCKIQSNTKGYKNNEERSKQILVNYSHHEVIEASKKLLLPNAKKTISNFVKHAKCSDKTFLVQLPVMLDNF